MKRKQQRPNSTSRIKVGSSGKVGELQEGSGDHVARRRRVHGGQVQAGRNVMRVIAFRESAAARWAVVLCDVAFDGELVLGLSLA